MSDKETGLVVVAMMQALVDKAGGVDAAAAIIGARLGKDISKGSISKRNSGQLSWPQDEIWALEGVLGDYRVSLYRAQQVPGVAEGQSLMQAVSNVYRETGEALSAAAAVAAGTGCRIAARKEVSEAVTAVKGLASLMEAGDV